MEGIEINNMDAKDIASYTSFLPGRASGTTYIRTNHIHYVRGTALKRSSAPALIRIMDAEGIEYKTAVLHDRTRFEDIVLCISQKDGDYIKRVYRKLRSEVQQFPRNKYYYV